MFVQNSISIFQSLTFFHIWSTVERILHGTNYRTIKKVKILEYSTHGFVLSKSLTNSTLESVEKISKNGRVDKDSIDKRAR